MALEHVMPFVPMLASYVMKQRYVKLAFQGTHSLRKVYVCLVLQTVASVQAVPRETALAVARDTSLTLKSPPAHHVQIIAKLVNNKCVWNASQALIYGTMVNVRNRVFSHALPVCKIILQLAHSVF